MISCRFYLPGLRRSVSSHIAQVVFGFLKLARDGVVDLSFSDESGKDFPACSWLAEINGKRVCYDTADANLNTPEEIDTLLEHKFDFIFKRSFAPEIAGEVKNRDRYLPLGLFYQFFCPRFGITAVAGGQRTAFSRRFARILRILSGRDGVYSLVPCTRKVDKYWTVGSEPEPDIDILFTTRLWGDYRTNPKGKYQALPLGHGACFTDAPDWNERTEERILLIRECRRLFQRRKIVCGVSDSPLARELCPDLILPHRVTERGNYRKLIRRSKVCVTTTGLWGSTGGRFTEFVSAGKAIVSSPLCHALPGEFAEGKNYLAFTRKEDFFAQCERLLTDAEEAKQMSMNNAWYHRHYVRPDMLVLNTLKTILGRAKSPLSK